MKPYPKHVHFKNGDLYFLIKKSFPHDFGFYACKSDMSFNPRQWGECSRVMIACSDDAETLRKLLAEVGFNPPCANGRRIMRCLVRAGYAVEL